MLTHRDIYQAWAKYKEAGYTGSLYCLIDHANMPGIVDTLTGAGVAWNSLFEHTGQESTLEAAPILFAIPAKDAELEDRKLLDFILQKGAFTNSVMFLLSPLAQADLTERLTKRLDAVLPDSMDILLRFYDPRTFENLMQVLQPEQKANFLAPANAWWYIDRRGALQGVNTKYGEDDTYEAPLKINQQQESALLENSEPDQVIQILRDNMPSDYEIVRPEQRYDFVLRHMAAAKALAIEATHEKALYCAMALTYGEKFAQLPNWKPVLQQVAEGKLRMFDAPHHVTELEQIWPGSPAAA